MSEPIEPVGPDGFTRLAGDLGYNRSQACVWIDPARIGGAPCIYGTRINTRMAAMMVWESGVDQALESWPHLTPSLLRGACWYEARYGPSKLRKAWAGWLDAWSDAMWHSEWENVPNPPRKAKAPRECEACGCELSWGRCWWCDDDATEPTTTRAATDLRDDEGGVR